MDLCCQNFVLIAHLPPVGSWAPTAHFKNCVVTYLKETVYSAEI